MDRWAQKRACVHACTHQLRLSAQLLRAVVAHLKESERAKRHVRPTTKCFQNVQAQRAAAEPSPMVLGGGDGGGDGGGGGGARGSEEARRAALALSGEEAWLRRGMAAGGVAASGDGGLGMGLDVGRCVCLRQRSCSACLRSLSHSLCTASSPLLLLSAPLPQLFPHAAHLTPLTACYLIWLLTYSSACLLIYLPACLLACLLAVEALVWVLAPAGA
jgi:hypothetical protein